MPPRAPQQTRMSTRSRASVPEEGHSLTEELQAVNKDKSRMGITVPPIEAPKTIGVTLEKHDLVIHMQQVQNWLAAREKLLQTSLGGFVEPILDTCSTEHNEYLIIQSLRLFMDKLCAEVINRRVVGKSFDPVTRQTVDEVGRYVESMIQSSTFR